MLIEIDDGLVNQAVEKLGLVTDFRYIELDEGTASNVTERAIKRYLTQVATRRLTQIAEDIVTVSTLREVLAAIDAESKAELIRQEALRQKRTAVSVT